jgi:Na+-driven multidrug efflux pump
MGMIINVILNLWLIPIYGIVGSALATLVSYSIATIAIGFSGKTSHQLIMMIKSILMINILKEIYKYGHGVYKKN